MRNKSHGVITKHGIFSIAWANLSEWISGSRMLMLGAILFLLCFTQTRASINVLIENKWSVSLGESWFLMLKNGFHILLSTTLFLLMLSELPQRTAFQALTLIRSNKGVWLWGQILYGIIAILFTLLLMIVAGSISYLGNVETGFFWTDEMRIMNGMPINFAIVPEFYRTNFSPITATLLALAPITLFWFTTELLLLLFGLLQHPRFGIMLCIFSLTAVFLLDTQTLPQLQGLLPANFMTLNAIKPDVNGMDHYWKILCTYMTIDTLLVVACFIVSKRIELSFNRSI